MHVDPRGGPAPLRGHGQSAVFRGPSPPSTHCHVASMWVCSGTPASHPPHCWSPQALVPQPSPGQPLQGHPTPPIPSLSSQGGAKPLSSQASVLCLLPWNPSPAPQTQTRTLATCHHRGFAQSNSGHTLAQMNNLISTNASNSDAPRRVDRGEGPGGGGGRTVVFQERARAPEPQSPQ